MDAVKIVFKECQMLKTPFNNVLWSLFLFLVVVAYCHRWKHRVNKDLDQPLSSHTTVTSSHHTTTFLHPPLHQQCYAPKNQFTEHWTDKTSSSINHWLQHQYKYSVMTQDHQYLWRFSGTHNHSQCTNWWELLRNN